MARTAINPERLKELRNQRNLSQRQLAECVRVDIGTVSRWERGEVRRLHSDTFDKLCSALKTTRTELCTSSPLSERPAEQEIASKGQINMMIDTACRNALALVARRYGITRQEIVEIAPLLFLIMAEQSLAKRRDQLERHCLSRDEAAGNAPLHLRSRLRALHDIDDEELMDAEESSIETRDLFAKKVRGWTDSRSIDNPFARYLGEKLAETGVAPGTSVAWDEGDAPRYKIGIDELVELLGEDEEARELVLKGKAALAEMPGDIRKAAAETRASWVKEKAVLNEQELQISLEKIDLKNAPDELLKTLDQSDDDL